MKNFTYHSQDEKDTLEAILRRRKRKVNHQQIVAAIITIILLTIFGLYICFHVYYSEFDGYVHVDANKVRTPFDIYLDSVYVKEGDVAAPGDTLYSYYNIDELVQTFNINSEPAVIGHYRDLTIQYENLQQQIAVIRARIQELQNQIAIENHNISYGLSSNSHKLDLERELNIARAQLAAQLRQLGVIGNMRVAAKPRFVNASQTFANGRQNVAQVYDDARSPLLIEARSYHLASDSAIITALNAPDRMVFFREEEIMTTQHIDLDANNLKVLAYIPIDKMHRITNNSVADVVVNSDFTFKAHVSVLGMRAEIIPENLRSYFSKKNTMVIAILEFDKGQYVPFWTMADGLPVDVRIRNLDTFGEKPSAENYLWYKTGDGIQMNLPPEWIYPDSIPGYKDKKVEHADSTFVAADSIPEQKSVRQDTTRQAPAKPAAQQPTQAPTQQPAKPAAQQPAQTPAKPVTQQPAQTPAKPAAQQPAQTPAKPAAQQPAQTPAKPAAQQPAQTPAKPAADKDNAQRPAAHQASDDGCLYYIVVDTMNKEQSAIVLVDKLKQYYPQIATLYTGRRWIVYVDCSASRQEAQRKLNAVARDGHVQQPYIWSLSMKTQN